MLLVIGDSNADAAAMIQRFPQEGDDIRAHAFLWSSGGAGVNVATAFARLGGRARLVSRVGTGSAADIALAEAARSGVDLTAIQRDPERSTGVCMVLVCPRAERTFLSYRGANASLEAPGASAWDGASRLHVCGHALLEGAQRETTLRLITDAERLKLPLSLDLCLPLIESDHPLSADLLSRFEIVFINDAELHRLVFQTRGSARSALDVERAATALRGHTIRTMVVKRSSEGSSVITQGGVTHIEPFEVVAKDTTAAGDAYVAGFLWALDSGADMSTAARLANALGALVASRPGSASALPARDELAQFVGERGASNLSALLSYSNPPQPEEAPPRSPPVGGESMS